MADSTLYFVRRDFDGAIKIGITTDLRRRLPDPRRQHGGMTLFGTVAGASTREKLAHLIFADSRLDGEFFQPTSALLFFLAQYALPPPVLHDKPGPRVPRTSHGRPWIDRYSDPLAVYDRDQFVRDYEGWIERAFVSSNKRTRLEIFRSFPEKIVFVPQPGLSGWGWTPLNPRCWTDLNGRRLHEG
jgi:hypothetical protein